MKPKLKFRFIFKVKLDEIYEGIYHITRYIKVSSFEKKIFVEINFIIFVLYIVKLL